jgi:hypothetical protein
MIKVSYTVRADDRMGYMEDGEKRFASMPEVFDFLKRIRVNHRVEGKILVGTPIVEDVQG